MNDMFSEYKEQINNLNPNYKLQVQYPLGYTDFGVVLEPFLGVNPLLWHGWEE